jgi:hypothetical protein
MKSPQMYRIYMLMNGHIDRPPAEIVCLTDQEAITTAQQFARARHVEVWQGARLVSVLNDHSLSHTG